MGKEILTPTQIANCANVICRRYEPEYSEFGLNRSFAASQDGVDTAKRAAEFVRIPGLLELENHLREISALHKKVKAKIIKDPEAKVVSYGNVVETGVHTGTHALEDRERKFQLKRGVLTLTLTGDNRFYIRFRREKPQPNNPNIFRELFAIVKANGDFVLWRNLVDVNKEKPVASQRWCLSRREIKQRKVGTGFTWIVGDLKRLFTNYLNTPL